MKYLNPYECIESRRKALLKCVSEDNDLTKAIEELTKLKITASNGLPADRYAQYSSLPAITLALTQPNLPVEKLFLKTQKAATGDVAVSGAGTVVYIASTAQGGLDRGNVVDCRGASFYMQIDDLKTAPSAKIINAYFDELKEAVDEDLKNANSRPDYMDVCTSVINTM